MPIADEMLEPGRVGAQDLDLVEVGAGAEMPALRADQDGAHTGAGLFEFINRRLDARMNGQRQAIEFFGARQLDHANGADTADDDKGCLTHYLFSLAY